MKASKAHEKLKDFCRRSKERSTISQHSGTEENDTSPEAEVEDHQTLWRSSDLEVLARHKRPHQTWKIFRLLKHPRDPDYTSDLSSYVVVHIKRFEHNFVLF